MKLKKFSHVIACDQRVCSLGYDKIVFNDGFVVTCGLKGNGIKRYFSEKSSISYLYYMVLTDGDCALCREEWILGRNDNGSYRIRVVQHTNIDRDGNYYKTDKILTISESTFNKYWKDNFNLNV